MKVICINQADRLTINHTYYVYHEYFDEYEVVNDLGHRKYYKKDLFREINNKY